MRRASVPRERGAEPRSHAVEAALPVAERGGGAVDRGVAAARLPSGDAVADEVGALGEAPARLQRLRAHRLERARRRAEAADLGRAAFEPLLEPFELRQRVRVALVQTL